MVTFETIVTVDHQLPCELPASLPVGSSIRVMVEPVMHDALVDNYRPRTEIGRRFERVRGKTRGRKSNEGEDW